MEGSGQGPSGTLIAVSGATALTLKQGVAARNVRARSTWSPVTSGPTIKSEGAQTFERADADLASVTAEGVGGPPACGNCQVIDIGGGGMQTSTLEDVTVSTPSNAATWIGINAVSSTGSVEIRRSTVVDHATGNNGAGILLNGNGTVSDSLVVIGGGNASGVLSLGGAVTLRQLTAVGSGAFGGVTAQEALSNVELHGSIVRGFQKDLRILNNGFLRATRSTFGTADPFENGGGNLVGADPMFVSPAGFDFRLRPGSPVIDRGAPRRSPRASRRPTGSALPACSTATATATRPRRGTSARSSTARSVPRSPPHPTPPSRGSS